MAVAESPSPEVFKKGADMALCNGPFGLEGLAVLGRGFGSVGSRVGLEDAGGLFQPL